LLFLGLPPDLSGLCFAALVQSSHP
jgi:hypothetical protein